MTNKLTNWWHCQPWKQLTANAFDAVQLASFREKRPKIPIPFNVAFRSFKLWNPLQMSGFSRAKSEHIPETKMNWKHKNKVVCKVYCISLIKVICCSSGLYQMVSGSWSLSIQSIKVCKLLLLNKIFILFKEASQGSIRTNCSIFFLNKNWLSW